MSQTLRLPHSSDAPIPGPLRGTRWTFPPAILLLEVAAFSVQPVVAL